MPEEKKDTPPPADDKTPPPADDKKTPPPADDKTPPPADDKKGDDKKTPDDQQPPKPGGKDGKSDDAPKAPEKYDLKVPEGSTHIDANDLPHFAAIAKANGWTNEQAQAFIVAHQDAVHAQRQTFIDTVKSDPDYGGDKLANTQRLAHLALNRIRPEGTTRGDALRYLLDKSGFGDHLEVISFLADIGKLMAEDTQPGVSFRGAAPSTKRDPATVLYGEQSAGA